MEKLISRIEAIIERQIEAFDAKPLSTSLKFIVFLWIFKFVYREIKR